MATTGGRQTIVSGSIRLSVPIAGPGGVEVRLTAEEGRPTTVAIPPIFQVARDLVTPIAPDSSQAAEAVFLPEELRAIVTAEVPIEVELAPKDPTQLSDAQAVFPVVQDDGFFYIAGAPVKRAELSATHRDSQKFALKVTQLPDVSGMSSGSSETRLAVGRALKLGFFKILRVPSRDTGLRIPRLENGKVFYEPVKPDQLAGGDRVALLVHGFLSETSWMVQALLPALQTARFSHIITWDYETFVTAIRPTAEALIDALRSAGVRGEPERLDVIAHSMGGLVVRTLIADGSAGDQIRRVLLMGTPNGGTPIAAAGDVVPAIASLLINHYFPGVSIGPVNPSIIVRYLWHKVERGMLDLKVDSDFIKWVNSNAANQTTPVTLVVGDAAADDPKGLFRHIFHKASDVFYGGANDLVVPIKSMEQPSDPTLPNVKAQNCTANHFNYLVDGKRSRTLVENWIG